MATLTRYQRQEREVIWQQNNHLPNSICEGMFYIWNKSKKEYCQHKDTCEKHKKYLEACNQGRAYDTPNVQFYYVENFRKCTLNNR